MGSLFAGIGGFDLGFTRAGFDVAWEVEIDPYCQKVLAKNFPEAERFGDIKFCGIHNLSPVDVICGGFPCQDISNAGKRAGINGERSGLWSEMHRVIRELRPRFVLVENVAALLGRGMGRVLGDLAEIGYDAEWEVISAADVGAPHLRERIWIMAYPDSDGCDARSQDKERFNRQAFSAAISPRKQWTDSSWTGELADTSSERCEDVANPLSDRCQRERNRPNIAGSNGSPQRGSVARGGHEANASHSDNTPTTRQREYSRQVYAQPESEGSFLSSGAGWWSVEPNVGRVAHGIPARMDRLRGLGNAVVPQIPEMFAHRIRQALEVA